MPIEVGKRNLSLIEARHQKGWSQGEMANHLLVSKSFYQKLESGQRKPGIHLAMIIEEKLGKDALGNSSLRTSA